MRAIKTRIGKFHTQDIGRSPKMEFQLLIPRAAFDGVCVESPGRTIRSAELFQKTSQEPFTKTTILLHEFLGDDLPAESPVYTSVNLPP